MFESAELGHNIDKATYDKQAPKLRADLLDAQFDVGELKKFPVIILINGVDGAVADVARFRFALHQETMPCVDNKSGPIRRAAKRAAMTDWRSR